MESFTIICMLHNRYTYLVWSSSPAADAVVAEGVGGVEVVDEDQFPSLCHDHLVAFRLQHNSDYE